MIARRDLVPQMLPRGSHQPLHRKQLFRGDHVVGAPGQQIDRKPQAREIDLVPQRDEASGGKFVALVEFLDDFEIVGSRNIDGPFIPGPEDGFEAAYSCEPVGSSVCSDRRMSSASTVSIPHSFATLRPITRPLPSLPGSETSSAASPRQAPTIRMAARRYRWARRPSRACALSKGSVRHRPATASRPAEPDEIDQASEFVDKNVQVGKIIVDSKKSPVGAGRTPIGHEQPLDSGIAEGGDEAVPGGEVGHGAAMQPRTACTARWARRCRLGEVAEPHRSQVERDPAWGDAFRPLDRSCRGGVESHQVGRPARQLAGRTAAAPAENAAYGKLTSETPIHCYNKCPFSSWRLSQFTLASLRTPGRSHGRHQRRHPDVRPWRRRNVVLLRPSWRTFLRNRDLGAWSIEGRVSAGEDPETAARREFAENSASRNGPCCRWAGSPE